MGSIVSSKLDFINKNPSHPVSFAEVEHELQHVRKREQISSAVAIVGTVLSMICLAGIIGGGAFILGALFAIAIVAALYSYCCRLADSGLRDRMTLNTDPGKGQLPPLVNPAFQKTNGGMLGYFSTSPEPSAPPLDSQLSK